MPIVPGVSTLKEVPKLLEKAKLSFVIALRRMFESSIADKDLRYSENTEETKIRIYSAYPLTLEFFPAIVVSASAGDVSFGYLQDDFIHDDVGAALVKYSGKLEFTISLTILSNSTLERERIMDHLIIFIRHVFKDLLRSYNMQFYREMRVGSESLTEVENKPVYEQTMDIPIYMEYHANIDQASLDTLRAIVVRSIAAVENIQNQ
jgi:hypothetical protein